MIGRGQDVDLVLEDADASRRHVQVVRRADQVARARPRLEERRRARRARARGARPHLATRRRRCASARTRSPSSTRRSKRSRELERAADEKYPNGRIHPAARAGTSRRPTRANRSRKYAERKTRETRRGATDATAPAVSGAAPIAEVPRRSEAPARARRADGTAPTSWWCCSPSACSPSPWSACIWLLQGEARELPRLPRRALRLLRAEHADRLPRRRATSLHAHRDVEHHGLAGRDLDDASLVGRFRVLEGDVVRAAESGMGRANGVTSMRCPSTMTSAQGRATTRKRPRAHRHELERALLSAGVGFGLAASIWMSTPPATASRSNPKKAAHRGPQRRARRMSITRLSACFAGDAGGSR